MATSRLRSLNWTSIGLWRSNEAFNLVESPRWLRGMTIGTIRPGVDCGRLAHVFFNIAEPKLCGVPVVAGARK
jgi:hypothetical protein